MEVRLDAMKLYGFRGQGALFHSYEQRQPGIMPLCDAGIALPEDQAEWEVSEVDCPQCESLLEELLTEEEPDGLLFAEVEGTSSDALPFHLLDEELKQSHHASGGYFGGADPRYYEGDDWNR